MHVHLNDNNANAVCMKDQQALRKRPTNRY